jgi:ketosteroid isomerase-like protein
MKSLLVAVAFLSVAFASPAAAQSVATESPPKAVASDSETHQELRALKDRLVAAVNNRDEKALVAELNPGIWFTAMNNETFHGLDGARQYYSKMLVGSNRILDEMSLTATPDDLSVLYADARVAVSTGTSNAHFKLRGGSEFDVPLRWSATLVKDGDKWTVASAHFSANIFDNPLVNPVKTFAYWVAGIGALLGLLIGWLIGRRRKVA